MSATTTTPDITLVTSAMSSIEAGNLTDAVGQLRRYLDQSGVMVLTDGTVYEGRLQYHDDGRPKVDTAECGACGFVWNDALITGVTPTPSGRCPNERDHLDDYDDGDDDR